MAILQASALASDVLHLSYQLFNLKTFTATNPISQQKFLWLEGRGPFLSYRTGPANDSARPGMPVCHSSAATGRHTSGL